MKKEEIGYSPEEFKKRGELLRYDLFEVHPNTILDYEGEPDVFNADQGDLIQVENDSLVVSHGANPCVAGVIIEYDHLISVFHSLGGSLGRETIEAISRAEGGIVGGGLETLTKYSDLFSASGFQIEYPEDERRDFAIAVVNRNIPDIPRGIHFGYGLLEEPFEPS